MRLSSSLPAAILTILATCCATCVQAQSTLGSISGSAQDATAAMVPNAKLRLHRTESNTDRLATTDSGGSFTAVNLEPGHYDITIDATGLASTTATGITLAARQQLRYDFTLKAGSVSDTVLVNATDAGIIDLDDAQISAALTPRAVLDLPAN